MARDSPGSARLDASERDRRSFLKISGGIAALGLGGFAECGSAGMSSIDGEVKQLAVDGQWQSVSLSSSYGAPAVFALPLSYDGRQGASPRVRNVSSNAFDIAVEEWLHLDGPHLSENVGCLVIDTGVSRLPDGRAVEVGVVETNHGWTEVTFDHEFSNRPLVLTQTQTQNGGQPVVTRNRNVSTTGMEVKLQEEEARGAHLTETVAYLAVQSGSGTLLGRQFEAGTVEQVGDDWQTIHFENQFRDPALLADVQTYNGWNTCTPRYRNLSESGVDVFVQEERSADAETNHIGERLGFVVVDRTDATPPSAPTGLNTTSASQNTVTLSWTPPSESDVAGYQIYGSTSKDFTASDETLLAESPDSEHTVSNLKSGSTYYFAVSTVDSSGNEGTLSSTVSAKMSGSASVERVLGYYTSWSRYDRNYMPSDVPLDKISHLLYAFLDLKENGEVIYGDEAGDKANLSKLQERKQNYPNTKMSLSIGGWTMSENFSDAALTAERRQRFAKTAIRLMRKYDFDGIDVDWEYPGGGGMAKNTVRSEDPQNFTLLLKELRRQLDAAGSEDGRDYDLSIAASANPTKIDRLETEKIETYVDYMNVMSYDFCGPWSDRTGFNTPLYSPSSDGSLDVDGGMQYWAKQGLAKSKLNLGLAFYARSFASVPDQNDGLYQPYDSTPSGTWSDPGVTDYVHVKNTLKPDSAYSSYWHDEAKVPWLYSPSKQVFVSYENPGSIGTKVQYAEQNEFGGVMFWEFYGDREGDLLTSIHQNLSGGV